MSGRMTQTDIGHASSRTGLGVADKDYVNIIKWYIGQRLKSE